MLRIVLYLKIPAHEDTTTLGNYPSLRDFSDYVFRGVFWYDVRQMRYQAERIPERRDYPAIQFDFIVRCVNLNLGNDGVATRMHRDPD